MLVPDVVFPFRGEAAGVDMGGGEERERRRFVKENCFLSDCGGFGMESSSGIFCDGDVCWLRWTLVCRMEDTQT